MMKYFVLFSLLVVAGSTWFWVSHKTSNTGDEFATFKESDLSTMKEVALPPVEVKGKKASDISSAPIKKELIVALIQKIEPTSKECSRFLTDISTFSLKEIVDDKKGMLLQDHSACSTFEKGKFAPALIAQREKYCLDPQLKDEKKCGTAMMMYRASVIDLLTKNEKLSDLDSTTLTNKLMSKFSNLNAPGVMTEADAIARALLEREPDLYAAKKAVAMLAVMEAMESNKPFLDGAEQFTKLRESSPTDHEVFEMEMIYWMKSDLSKAKERAAIFIEEDKNTGIGEYFLASLAWKEGKREEAIKFLAEAAKKSPQKRYIQTFFSLKKAPLKSEGLFTTNMSVDFSNL